MPNQHTTRPRTLTERFWSKVDRSDPDGCWPWLAGTVDGYGRFGIAGYPHRAHRVAYLLTHGPFPNELRIRHTCDNRICVNPAHLLAGTDADNVADMVERGRQATGARHGMHTHPESRPVGERSGAKRHPERIPIGERNGASKLTTESVRTMRALYTQGGTSYADLSERFGVALMTVHDVIRRKNWRHVD